MTSAYPVSLATLVEQVKARAVELGQVPSRNRIKSEFKVGAPKAAAVLAELDAIGFDPVQPDVTTPRRLHAVPPAEPTTDAPTEPVPVIEPEQSESAEPIPSVASVVETETAATEVSTAVDPVPTTPEPSPGKRTGSVKSWPLLLLALGAFVAIWGGWVGLGELTGFGPIRLLPGIADDFVINSAITLPIGVEAYAAYALRVWLSGNTRSDKARRFARWSAIGSLVLGAAGQVAYHLMVAAGITTAPWWITTFVSCLPVVVLGCGAALTHLLHAERTEDGR